MPPKLSSTLVPSPQTKIPVIWPPLGTITRSQAKHKSQKANNTADEPAIHVSLQAHNIELTEIRGQLDAILVEVSNLKSKSDQPKSTGLLVAFFALGLYYGKQTHVGNQRPLSRKNLHDENILGIESASNNIGANDTCSLSDSNETSVKQFLTAANTLPNATTTMQNQSPAQFYTPPRQAPPSQAPPHQTHVPLNQFWPTSMPPPPPAVCRSWSDVTKAAPIPRVHPNKAIELTSNLIVEAVPRNRNTTMGPYGDSHPEYQQNHSYQSRFYQHQQQVHYQREMQWRNNNGWQTIGRNGRTIHPAAQHHDSSARAQPRPQPVSTPTPPAHAAQNRHNHPHQPLDHPKKTPKFNQYLKEVRILTKKGKLVHPDSKCTIKDAAGDLLLATGYKGQAVGADFAMNAGLAKQTKDRYQINTRELRNSHPDAKPGYIARIRVEDGSCMLLLVSKPVSTQKLHHDPDGHVQGARDMVSNLAKYTNDHGITELTLPYLCSGLDGLNRLFVRQLFLDAFRLQNITITFLTYKRHGRHREGQVVRNNNAPTTPTATAPERNNENAESDFRHGPAPVDMNA
jgi:hypothetical protein